MLADDLLCAQFCGTFKGHFLVRPWCAYHPQGFALRRSQRAIHHIAHAVHKAQPHMVAARQCNIHCFRWNKRRFCRHHRASRSALRQIVLCSRANMRVLDRRNHHFFHQTSDKCGFSRSHRTNDSDIHIALCTLSNILIQIIRLHNIPPCRHANVCLPSARYYAS